LSLLDSALGALRPPLKAPESIPGDVKKPLARGRKAMLKDAPKRRLCMRFRKGETLWYLTGQNVLNQQGTATGPGANGGKPSWRIRNRYDFLGPIVDEKVSMATARVPGFEVNASTPDSERKGAAKLSETTLRFGYDKWRMRKAATKAIDLAVGGGGRSYTLAYFDANVGPYTPVPDPATGQVRMVGQGEIRLLVLTGNEVYAEPGVDFNDSPWYAIERARPIDEVKQTPGYCGGDLKPDASTSDIPTDREKSDNMVMVTEYFERPCPKYPEGRCMTFAAGKPIVDYRR
jgi:hypothetical protein